MDGKVAKAELRTEYAFGGVTAELAGGRDAKAELRTDNALGVLMAEGGGTGTGARKLLSTALDAGGEAGADATGVEVGPMGITTGISVV